MNAKELLCDKGGNPDIVHLTRTPGSHNHWLHEPRIKREEFKILTHTAYILYIGKTVEHLLLCSLKTTQHY